MFVLPDVSAIVALALAEDLGVPAEHFAPGASATPGLLARDVTSSSAIDADARFSGRVVAREACVVAGLPVVHAVFDALSAAAGLFDPIEVFPLVAEGASVEPGTPVLDIEGVATAVLTGERTALNFLQLLCATASVTARYVQAVAGTSCQILDTRKTLPGLRTAQKYAVRIGGGRNHRMGLYDLVLIKENHIAAAGSIDGAVRAARHCAPDVPVEVETENLAELAAALAAGSDIIMLDDFSVPDMRRAVAINRAAPRPAKLEASGGVSLDALAAIAATGVDYISIGSLTKHVQAVDLSMRIDNDQPALNPGR